MSSLGTIRNWIFLRNRVRLNALVPRCLISNTSQVRLPKAIKRGPIDLLNALSSTVHHDSTSCPYPLVDDHFLSHGRIQLRRMFFHSQNSGRAAARYFFEQYPELFVHDISEPKIDAYTYKELYDDTMDFTIDDLKFCIEKFDIKNAIVCFNKLKEQGKQFETGIVDDLLDLACFYNSGAESVPDLQVDFFESLMSFKPEPLFNEWTDGGFAEVLFDEIEHKSDRNYMAIIRGMIKHGEALKSYNIYEKTVQTDIMLDTQTYNDVISIVYFVKQTNDERWSTLKSILKTMETKDIKPDHNTLHMSLKVIQRFKFDSKAFNKAKLLYNELAFKYDIRPTLLINAIMDSLHDQSKEKIVKTNSDIDAIDLDDTSKIVQMRNANAEMDDETGEEDIKK